MTVRRTNAPRKRPVPAPATRVIVPAVNNNKVKVAEADAAPAIDEVALDPHEIANDLLNQVDDLLRSDGLIGQQDREAFTEQFAAILRQVVNTGEYANIDTESVLQDSVEQLKHYAAEVETDVGDNELARQLSSALAPLEQRKTKVALEFGRRLQVDGQESALAWLREQQKEGEQRAAAGNQSVPDRGSIRTPDEVTKSRSRRLRGPP